MRTRLLAIAILCAAVTAAQATTLRGTLKNLSSNSPGVASSVRLIDMTNNMDQIGMTVPVDGNFVFEDVVARQAPYLIQVQSGGVLYSKTIPVPEGSDDDVQVEFEVYDATDSLADVEISMFHMIFERQHETLSVMQFFEFENHNSPPQAVWRENGPITIQLPPEAQEPFEVSVNTTSRMPLRQELLETDIENIYTVPYVLKPGTTRIVVRYTMPYTADSAAIHVAVHHPVLQSSILLSPEDVLLESNDFVRSEDAPPVDGYAVYLGNSLSEGQEIDIHLSGGSEHSENAHGDDPHAGGTPSRATTDIERIDVRPNRLAQGRPQVLMLVGLGGILMLGLLIATSTPEPKQPRASRGEAIADLEEQFAAGKISREKFLSQVQSMKPSKDERVGSASH